MDTFSHYDSNADYLKILMSRYPAMYIDLSTAIEIALEQLPNLPENAFARATLEHALQETEDMFFEEFNKTLVAEIKAIFMEEDI